MDIEIELEQAPFPKHIDIGIVTISQNPELSAILRVFKLEGAKPNDEDEGVEYWVIRSTRRNSLITSVICCVDKPGTHPVRTITEKLIKRFSPKYITLVGIAAGVRNETRLGDVVIADKVIYYEPAKMKSDGTEAPRYEEIPQPKDGKEVRKLAREVDDLNWRDKFHVFQGRLAEKGNSPAELISPKCHVAPIVCGEKVIENGKLESLRKNYNERIRAGDMEGYGLAEAARDKKIEWLIIRGISDFGDEDSRSGINKDAFHTTAANAAAAWCFGWLDSLLSSKRLPFEAAKMVQLELPWNLRGSPIQLGSMNEVYFWEQLAKDQVLHLKFVLPSGKFQGAIGQLPLVSDAMFLCEITTALSQLIRDRLRLEVNVCFDIDVVTKGDKGPTDYRLVTDLLRNENLVLTATGDINLATRLLYKDFIPPNIRPGPTSPDSESFAGVRRSYPSVIFPDIGFISIFRSPFNDNRIIALAGGTFAIGTLGSQKLLAAYITGVARFFGNNLEDPEIPVKIVEFPRRNYDFHLLEVDRTIPPMELMNIDFDRLLKNMKVLE